MAFLKIKSFGDNLAAIKFGVSPPPVYAVYDRRIYWRRQILAKTCNSPNSPNIIARQNLLIYSIQIHQNTIKISQLADDTTIIVQDIKSVEAVLGFLSTFSKYSGLYLNKSKTEAVWLGKNVHNKDKPLGLRWNNGYFKCLGIWCHTDTARMIDKNYTEKN